MLCVPFDLVEPLQQLAVTPESKEAPLEQLLSKIQLVACLETLQKEPFTITPLCDLIVSYTLPASSRFLEAAETAASNHEFVATDLCAESFHPDAPRSVLACIQKHVQNPLFQKNPAGYVQQLTNATDSRDTIETRAIEFLKQQISIPK